MEKEVNSKPASISGIDTLYFFYESNNTYTQFFSKLLQQLENIKKEFEQFQASYENKDIKILIQEYLFEFNGKAQGFYWFTQIDNYFSVGFKDPQTNKQLHNIQIQLNAKGIYKLGIKLLLNVCDLILDDIITGYKPITRADLNIFVQTDLSWITKEMFVSRKRNYTSHIKEIASKYKLQTLYIGKDPFMLRIYDKQEELKNSPKKELMDVYFLTNGFDTQKPIFNIEFELHRKFLRSYSIDTIEDLLSQAEKLFRECMNTIRLVELSSISSGSISSYNRYKAQTHPLWKNLSSSYKLDMFLQVDKELIKIKRKDTIYTTTEAIKDHIELAKKAFSYNILIDENFYSEVLSVLRSNSGTFFCEHYSKNNDLASEAR